MSYELIGVTTSGHVGVIEMQRGPNNFVSTPLVAEVADALEAFDGQTQIRAVVLCAQGKHFCAGADFAKRPAGATVATGPREKHLYKEAIRLWRTQKPFVAAVQGAAIGAGLGLAVSADFRVAGPDARFSANFNRLGYHPGFGLTVTLPRLVGHQKAALMMYTGRRLTGEQALEIGLADMLVPQDQVRDAAMKLAAEIAECAPLSIVSSRETQRRGLAEAVQAATEREFQEQNWLGQTEDFKEGTKAMNERRLPVFNAR